MLDREASTTLKPNAPDADVKLSGDVFGALINLLPGKDGLLHISQIAHERVEKVTDYLSEGQIVKVKVMETDEKGRIKLSMKALLERQAQENRG